MRKENTSLAWPHGEATFVINPAKRKTLEMGALAVSLAAALVYSLALNPTGPVQKWATRVDKEREAEQYAPRMRELADAGKPDAVIWLAKHFPGTEAQRLKPLIDAGSGEAAWTLAGASWKTDRPEAERLMRVAADLGYLPAIQWAQRSQR